MILFSGSVVVATLLINLILAHSRDGLDFIDPAETLRTSGISDRELKEIGLIYHYMETDGYIRRFCHNLEMMPDQNSHERAASGSGVFNFFDNMQTLGRFAVDERENEQAEFIARVATHSLFELVGTESLDYLYGGWFEVTFANPLGFEKIPYAIKMWRNDGETLASGGPLFFGWYNGCKLIVSRLNFFEDKGHTKFKSDHYLVEDFLNRDRQMGIPQAVSVPYFVVHIVIGEDRRTHNVRAMPYGDSNFILEVGPEGIRCSWTHDLRHQLFTAPPTGPSLSLASDPD